MKHILSYGGGVNSSALFFYLIEKKMPIDLVIFSNTGEETTTTYEAVERIKKECKLRDVEFIEVQSHFGNLYDYYYKRKAVMEIMRRGCTSKFKISPIRKYIRERYGKNETFVMYIGIAWEEATRMRTSDVKYMVYSYPFCDDKITRLGNYKILKKYNFIAKKSGCKGCMFTKRKDWIKMVIDNPKEFDRHLKLEENNKRFPEITLNGQYRLRSLINFKNQQTLENYNDIEPTCEVSGGCFL